MFIKISIFDTYANFVNAPPPFINAPFINAPGLQNFINAPPLLTAGRGYSNAHPKQSLSIHIIIQCLSQDPESGRNGVVNGGSHPTLQHVPRVRMTVVAASFSK